MQFNSVEPDINYDIMKFRSTEGRWEMGLRSVLFGVRVRLSQVGSGWCVLDYCAGNDPGFALTLLAVVAKILERYQEEVSEATLENAFPGYERKPINRDPKCWNRLQEMAMEDYE